MTLKRLFADFEAERSRAQAPARSETPSAQSDARDNASFEAGYASGWEDATRAAETRGQSVSAELERTVQDLGFTYHEALDQLRGQFLVALEQFVDAILPETTPDLVGEHLRVALAEVGDELSSATIELAISPGQRDVYESLLSKTAGVEVTLQEDDSLGPDQAFLRFNTEETMLDFKPIVDGFRNQIAALRGGQPKGMKDAG